MEIAYTTLLIVLIILPGIIFRYFYRKGVWNCPVYLSSFANELFYGIVFAVIINFVFYISLNHTPWRFDFKVLLAVMSGNIDSSNIITISENLDHHFALILSYLLLMDIFAFISGLFLHLLVRNLKLDLKFGFFRFNNEWYYTLRGEQVIIDDLKKFTFFERFMIRPDRVNHILKSMFTNASAVIVIGERKYLYWGIVSDFYFNKKGDLERIVLQEAHRRDLDDDKDGPSGCEPSEDNRFYKIEGEYLIMNYSDILTLNVDYRFLLPEVDSKDTEKI